MSVGGGTCHSAQILEIVADQYVMFGEVFFQAHVYLHFREALGVAGIFAPGGRDACQRTFQIDVGTEADAFQPYLQMLVRCAAGYFLRSFQFRGEIPQTFNVYLTAASGNLSRSSHRPS